MERYGITLLIWHHIHYIDLIVKVDKIRIAGTVEEH